MAVTEASPDQNDGMIFRPTGAVTIVRAGSISREIDSLPDPLAIDLGGVERMDTVGAWLIHRAVRDRGARVTGASPQLAGLMAFFHL